MKKNKIAIICNTAGALYNFRKPLIEFHVKDEWEVQTFSNSEGNYFPELKELNCTPNDIKFSQKNNFFNNLKIIFKSILLIKKFNPDIIHIYTLQPSILLSIPLRIIGFKSIFTTVTGMGRNFDIYDKPLSIRQKLILRLLKISFRANKKVIVQNNYDYNFLLNHNVISSNKIIKVNGSGMDISKRSEKLLQNDFNSEFQHIKNKGLDKKIILFAARGMKEKGLINFAESAKMVLKINPNFLFVHAGSYPDYMTKFEYEEFANKYNFTILGYTKNIESLFRISDVIVLPSLYREGTPKSLIEAIYYNKIIITNDIAGCNETVIDGANGWLTKAGSTNDLVSKILKVDELNVSMIKKTNDALINKYDIMKIYELNKSLYL
jgi:N,N'-diacetylbacillosaminyl-diphospho-undecaprenol alpha-1,3-N-acetylgalactosaminyltransferase